VGFEIISDDERRRERVNEGKDVIRACVVRRRDKSNIWRWGVGEVQKY